MDNPYTNAIATTVEQLIVIVRDQKVILDSNLAKLYQVETKKLIESVKRNRNRFPSDFMFQLTNEEYQNLRFQIGTSNQYGGRRYLPYAFTEQGVAMLSSVLRSQQAITVNIEIMRAFVRMRELILGQDTVNKRLDQFEEELSSHSEQIKKIFSLIRSMITDKGSTRMIGFRRDKNE